MIILVEWRTISYFLIDAAKLKIAELMLDQSATRQQPKGGEQRNWVEIKEEIVLKKF